MDSNHRSHKTTDLQSVAFGRSAIFPYGLFGCSPPLDWKSCDWCLESESNQRHKDFQSFALPTELSRHWRPGRGSNSRPPAWQAGALTNWATGPYCLLVLNQHLLSLISPSNKIRWWTFTDSNRGPTGYEPVALTNWAKGPNEMVGVKRLELPAPWSQTTCATNCATPRHLCWLLYDTTKLNQCQPFFIIFLKFFKNFKIIYLYHFIITTSPIF